MKEACRTTWRRRRRNVPTPALAALAALTIVAALVSAEGGGSHNATSDAAAAAAVANATKTAMTPTEADEPDAAAPSCGVVALLPFTSQGKRPNAEITLDVPIDHMAATLMAIDHFNDRDPTVVSALGGPNAAEYMKTCDVTIPAIPGWTVKDDGDFTTNSVRALLEADEEREVNAVVGPYSNKAALGAAHASGAMEAPLLSYGAADTAKLGRLHIYPLTAKITADEYSKANAVMDYLKNYKQRDYVTLLHTTDQLDHSVKVLDQAAKKYEVTFRTEAIKPKALTTGSAFNIPDAMKRIVESGYRTVIVALTKDSHWESVVEAADEYGLTGPDAGYFWMMWDTSHTSLLTKKTDSGKRQRLLHGAGTINVLDKFAYLGEGDPFLASWRSRNSTFVRRLDELNPIRRKEGDEEDPPGYFLVPDDYFETRDSPSTYSSYIYDSVISIGLGACKARAKELEAKIPLERRRRELVVKWPNTATDNALFNEMVTVEFEGASGSVVLHDEELYNRNPKTIAFGMYNLRLEGGGLPPQADLVVERGFEAVLTSHRLPGEAWSPAEGGDDFTYADGTTNQQILKTAVEEDRTVWYVVIGFLCAGFVAAVLVVLYVSHKRKQADSVWSVDPSELKFHQPPEVIGQGTFGLVVLAEYRGTQVAVKRVLPVSAKGGSSGSVNFFTSNILDSTIPSETVDGDDGGDADIEKGVAVGQRSGGTDSTKKDGFRSGSLDRDKESQTSWIPLATPQNQLQKKLRSDFVAEMRYLSKLRHPCITTVMGAVIAKKHDPMLVMEYMDHGSLHDLLHNETLLLDGDLVLPILRDIAQGLRFLHAANPQVVHGDLKAANVLVDSKFRAKVADFGLSQKKKLNAAGTPYWMAPELLRRESSATAASDMYSFGIILYEVYSRKDPYEGEKYADVISMVADPLVSKRPPVPPSCPKSVATIMTDCLKGSPEFRPTSEELDKELKRLDVVSAGPMNAATGSSKRLSKTKADGEDEHRLLYELLPKHVADVLRSGGKVEPESKDLVTIFFSDIVGFTDISSSLTPLKISDMLDRLYHEFDELSQEHDVFKVETIGDAYMAVTNLIKDQADDHAKRIARFAIDAIKAANRTLIDTDEPGKGYVNIRVGFHSGPVVANVVGTRNPRYCLFGDTVNTASRMESNSLKNRIHCSARAAGLLLTQWPESVLEHRGRISVKGKGQMRTFWVNEPRKSAVGRIPARRSSAILKKPSADGQPSEEKRGRSRRLTE